MSDEASNQTPTLVHHLFEAQVAVRPLAPAVTCEERVLVYQDVETQANRLAHRLREHGARRGRFVAIYLERSERAIVTILAVLKSGAAYVPIDPVYPPERIRHILSDADVRCVVTEGALAETARTWQPPREVIALDDPSIDPLGRGDATPLPRTDGDATPEDLAYVMYTSGTTGRPKGIMTEHRNVVSFTAAFQAVCGITPEDRVFQGFSLGFDGSVEEYVLAFAGGAPLVVGPSALSRDGPETRRHLAAQGVTYFSTVPTFLRLLDADVPSLRLIVVSGEPCPPDLVRRWTTPGRRMLNVYGPTETTVNTTSWECVPDEPVSIGTPLPGYRTYILDPSGQPVTNGPGELFIGGLGVARGYLNQPDLTASVFSPDPFAAMEGARMYRTGDLVEADPVGGLRFLGRIDSQVKVHGFRIELDEIEAVLREYAGIDAAAASVVERDGQTFLAAHILASDLDRGGLTAHLRSRLPPYMVPAFVDIVPALPRLASGKLDRRSLPAPQARLVESTRPIVPPRTIDEARLVAMWETLFRTAPVSIEDDFFLDLGGDSLLATSFINTLHETLHRNAALRDVYHHPTIAGLAPIVFADRLAADSDGETTPSASSDVWAQTPMATRAVSVVLQVVGAMGLYGLASVIPFVMLAVVHSVVSGGRSPARGAAFIVAITAVSYPLWLGLTIALKWILVGRYRPRRLSAYGVGYVRFWLARRAQAMSGAALLAGTPLMSIYYRLMGAQVGRRCLIDTVHCAAMDLVTIGDDSSIGAGTHLLGYRLADGHVEFGAVTIGRGCFVGTHSALDIETRVGDEGRLGDQSCLVRGEAIPEHASWRGSPAAPGDVSVPTATSAVRSTALLSTGMLSATFSALVIALELITLAALVPAAALAWSLRSSTDIAIALVAAAPISVLTLCGVLAGMKAVVLRRLAPGTYSVQSGLYVRKWFADSLVMLSRVYLHPLYTTIYLPPFLRTLGARIGRLAEISTIGEGAPDLFDLGDQSFFADGSMIGGRRFHRGQFEVAVSRVGRRSFVGNSAILPVGSQLGDGCLLGVLSTSPEATPIAPDGTEWLGSPSFRLPHRRKVEGFDAAVTYEPTRRLFAHRLVVDAVRVLVPGVILLGVGLAAYQLTAIARAHLSTMWTLALLPLAATFLAAVVVMAVALLKIVVMGRFEPVVAPLWAPYVWWNEVINGAWEALAAPALGPVVGSPLFTVALRMMGCHVGRGSRVHTTLFSEFDLVRIGRCAVLGEGAVAQNHLFEDRIMKSSTVVIGDDVSIGNMAIVLYDTELGTGSRVDPLSLVMKGARVPPKARWAGIPACPYATKSGGR